MPPRRPAGETPAVLNRKLAAEEMIYLHLRHRIPWETCYQRTHPHSTANPKNRTKQAYRLAHWYRTQHPDGYAELAERAFADSIQAVAEPRRRAVEEAFQIARQEREAKEMERLRAQHKGFEPVPGNPNVWRRTSPARTTPPT